MRTLVILVGAFTLFVVQSTARTVHIHFTEFRPAQREWEAAHARGDRTGMEAAFDKELAAARRTIDPLWFAR